MLGSYLYIRLYRILLKVRVFHRTRLRIFGLNSIISSAHILSEAAMAAFTLSSTPEIADLYAKTLPTGKISGLIDISVCVKPWKILFEISLFLT